MVTEFGRGKQEIEESHKRVRLSCGLLPLSSDLQQIGRQLKACYSLETVSLIHLGESQRWQRKQLVPTIQTEPPTAIPMPANF